MIFLFSYSYLKIVNKNLHDYNNVVVVKPTPLSVVVHTDTSQQIPMYKSSFESVMQAAISKTAEIWTNFPETFKNKRSTLNIRNTPFLRSDIMTPRKNNLSSLLRG